ncbi:putative enzyme [Candidatus Hydrogenisulfobacillus filiaventi]|uniref:Putative enzyme n=1 Tax=Candidatus Hydrogenisulfobacillus filiaventi TaxID=2707344 RepID=A0A6F8ZGI7_9FIRM|nr:putative enzyme [Candidatus Hydrogenisulfobacillus filiaventi]
MSTGTGDLAGWAALLVAILPLAAAGGGILAGPRLQGRVYRLTLGAEVAAFALTVGISLPVVRGGPLEVPLYTWLQLPGFTIQAGLYVDRLTLVMLLLVTGISAMVQAFSIRYLRGDAAYDGFFLLVALVTWSVTLVVMADNLLMLFGGWEMVSAGLYLLLTHAHHRPAARAAARKTLLLQLAADVPFLAGVILTAVFFGTLNLPHLADRVASGAVRVVPLGWPGLPGFQVPAATLVALLLFAGAAGKSAQLPFHLWLPETMEAPTPVSALMHAGIVNAGGYLIARLSPLFHQSVLASAVVALTGAVTAVYGTTLMLAQPDYKRGLGYSTMGQMGFMVLEGGLGADERAGTRPDGGGGTGGLRLDNPGLGGPGAMACPGGACPGQGSWGPCWGWGPWRRLMPRVCTPWPGSWPPTWRPPRRRAGYGRRWQGGWC